MRRIGRYLKTIAWFEGADPWPWDGTPDAPSKDIGVFPPGMRVPRDGHSRLYGRFHEYRRIARRRTVGLRQNLSRDAGRGCGRRTLRRRFRGNKAAHCADRARRKTRKSSSRQHDVLPALSESSAPRLLDADGTSVTTA